MEGEKDEEYGWSGSRAAMSAAIVVQVEFSLILPHAPPSGAVEWQSQEMREPFQATKKSWVDERWM